MRSQIVGMSAAGIARRVRGGELSAVEVVAAFGEQMAETEPRLRAWVTVDLDGARRQAEEIDRARARGESLGLLAGVPVGVKDIFNTKDFPTEMGSPLWKGFTPGNDARCVHYVREHHGIVLGKTVTAEFAVHELRETLHPLDASRNPGTSSTGSAVAVAARHVPFALGTQTAGSIIRPASYCGVWGYKPSFGLIPRTGMLKTTDTLDTPGFFVRAPADLRPALEALRVHGRDFPLSDAALADPVRQNKPSGRPWRVALVRPHTWARAEAYAKEGLARELARWRSRGVDVIEVELPPSTREAHGVHQTIYDKTLAYYFKGEYAKAQLVSPTFRRMVEHGLGITNEQYQAALERQRAIADDLDACFDPVDAFVTLSVAGEAVARDAEEPDDSCLLWTLAMLPALNVPVMVGPRGLPVGLQLVGRRYNDLRLIGLVEHLAEIGLTEPAPPGDVEGSGPPAASGSRDGARREDRR